MRLLLQRVSRARVTVDGEMTGEIRQGLLVLVGLGAADSAALFPAATEKMLNLRIFADDEGKMNRSVRDIGGGVLLVSQFTLYADARKGRRPSYIHAMAPAEAEPLFSAFREHVSRVYAEGVVAGGRFGAMMDVELVNAGPVTIWLDSAELGWE